MLKKIRYLAEYLLVNGLRYFVSKLPISFLRFIAKLLGYLGYYFDIRGRKTSLENLKVVFKNKYSLEERIKIVKKSYYYFTLTFLELFWSTNINSNNVDNFINLEYEDQVKTEEAFKKGSIFITVHYSNFEWLSYIVGIKGFKLQIVAQDFKNQKLTSLFSKIRSSSDHHLTSSNYAYIKNYKWLKNNKPIGFLSDLSAKPNKSSTVIDCFDLKTCVTALHANLVKKINSDIITAICLPPDKNSKKYTMKFFKPFKVDKDEDINQIVQKCWDKFEKIILDDPAPWIWMYKHWRYKPSDKVNQNIEYPIYSNTNKKFQELLDIK